MVINQRGLCAICGNSPDLNKQHTGLVIDHCHTSGSVRALLCHKCNQALGLFKDNINSLKNAIEYLKKYKEN